LVPVQGETPNCLIDKQMIRWQEVIK